MALAGLSGKIAVVTGTGSGIGRAVAYRFAKEGVALTLADINLEAMQETLKEVKALGGKAIAVKTDVTSPDEVAALFQAALKEYGTVDILVNCAGISREVKGIWDVDVWDKVMRTNLYSVYFTIREALKIMEPKQAGCIISTSSIGGTRRAGGAPAYGASKAGVYALTQTVAREMASKGIRVNAVAPGYVDTNLVPSLVDPNSAQRKAMEAKIPLENRFARPSELASVFAFLASDDASYITGELISANGGVVLF